MLEQLFGSKTRVKLLRLFLNNPDKAYYLRELARTIQSQLNSVRREAMNLEKIGILLCGSKEKAPEKKKNPSSKSYLLESNRKSSTFKKYYHTNTNFILYSELKALLIKTQLLVESDFILEIKKVSNTYYLVLTGIFVGLNNHIVDMLLVGKVNRRKLMSIVKKFEKELNHSINYTVMSRSEFKYRKDITDQFLYSILENNKIVVVDRL